MSKKHKALVAKQAADAQAAASSAGGGPAVWLPAAALWTVAIYVITRSFGAHNYTQYAYFVENDALNFLSWTWLLLAGLLAVIPPLRRAVAANLEDIAAGPKWKHAAWLGAAFAGFFAWSWFLRYCQYRAFLLPTDTSQMVAFGYVFTHGFQLHYPIWDMHPLAEHFYWVVPILSPALFIWGHPLSLLLAHHLLVASIPFAGYALAYRLSGSSFNAALLLLLYLASPFFFELLTANPSVAILPALVLWGLYFLYSRLWIPAAFCLFLTAGCNEQAPFLYFGFGLYLAWSLRDKKPWNWAAAAAVCIGAVLMWKSEMLLIESIQRHYNDVKLGTAKWLLFRDLVPPGTPDEQTLRVMASHPLRTLGRLFSSVYRFYPIGRVLFSTALFPLLAPMQLIPFAVVFAPHFLAATPDKVPFFDFHPLIYADFGLHHSAYITGPLLWAAAFGILKARKTLEARHWESWLLVWVLFVASFGYKHAHRTLHPQWRLSWFDAMPRVMAKIPPDAPLWGDEYALSPGSYRRYLKNIQWGPEEPWGYKNLFVPDYALFDKAFVQFAKPPYRDQMLTFFARYGFRKIADDNNVILLKNPNPAGSAAPPRLEKLPDADPKLVQIYGNYIVSAAPESN